MRQTQKEQLAEFARLRSLREEIYNKCQLIKCKHLEKCSKRGVVCSISSAEHARCRRAGANFNTYLILRNKIVTAWLPLAKQKLPAIIRGVLEHDNCNDMQQEAAYGIIRAVEMFDPAKGERFDRCAIAWMRKKVLKSRARDFLVRRKEGSVLSYVTTQIAQIFDQLVQEKVEITAEEILKRINQRRAKKGLDKIKYVQFERFKLEIEILMRQLKYPIVIQPSDEAIIASVQEQGHGFYDLLCKKLDDALQDLPIRTSEILRMRFGLGEYEEPMESQEVAAILGMTKQNVEVIVRNFFSKKAQYL